MILPTLGQATEIDEVKACFLDVDTSGIQVNVKDMQGYNACIYIRYKQKRCACWVWCLNSWDG